MPNIVHNAADKIRHVKEALRHPYSFPGGYVKAVYMMDGERLCLACILANWREIVTETRHPNSGDRGWGILGVDIYWEGPPEHCAHCNAALESEYGDPDAPEGVY